MAICAIGAVQVILKDGDIVLHPLGLPWFVWTAAALLPFGAAAYAHKFYRNHRGSLILWTRVAVLALVQVVLFLLSFAFFPRFALLVNLVALPLEYRLLDNNLKDRGIQRNVKGRVF